MPKAGLVTRVKS